jgi:hypothetical protein
MCQKSVLTPEKDNKNIEKKKGAKHHTITPKREQ